MNGNPTCQSGSHCPSGDCNRLFAATSFTARDWLATPGMHEESQRCELEMVSGLSLTAKRLIPPFTAYGYSTGPQKRPFLLLFPARISKAHPGFRGATRRSISDP